MLNKIVFTIAMVTVSVFSGIDTYAQPSSHEKENVKKDSVEHSVMLVPYDPRFYLSDSDREIAEVSKKSPELIRKRMHSRAEWYTYKAIKRKYPAVSLLQNDTIEAYIEAAEALFSNSNLLYAKPVLDAPAALQLSLNKEVNKDAVDSRTATKYLNENGRSQFMKADFRKKEVLESLYKQFGTDLFVFLTQLEIKTNYKNCLDIANKIYQREVMLHFTVYDRSGKLIGGNYAVAFIPSDVNNIDDIITTCFPELGEAIASTF